MATAIYVLGGYQTDFAANWARRAASSPMACAKCSSGASAASTSSRATSRRPTSATSPPSCSATRAISAASSPPRTRDLAGIPASRHEGACASGSLAALAASAELEAGRYGLAAVIGIEQMRNVPGDQAAALIGQPAMWAGHECQDVKYPVAARLQPARRRNTTGATACAASTSARIAEINFANARRNPNAQTRRWQFTPRELHRGRAGRTRHRRPHAQAGLRPDQRRRGGRVPRDRGGGARLGREARPAR